MQRRWPEDAAARPGLFKPPVPARVSETLESPDAIAVVAAATLKETVYRCGATDATSDIPAMARPDTIWSTSAAFVACAVVMESLDRRRELGTVDINFDAKGLRAPHTEAWRGALRELVANEAKRYAQKRGMPQLRGLAIRRAEAVAKGGRGTARGKVEIGTWVADRLCRLPAGPDMSKAQPRVRTIAMSDSLRRTVQRPDGKKFRDQR